MAKKKRSRKSASTANPIPAKLFSGKNIVVAGKFGHPDKEAIVSFLKQQGAKLSGSVNAKTDIAILGTGTSSITKQIDKLNLSGKATIETTDDIYALLDFDPEQIYATLTDPQRLPRLIALPDWLQRTIDFTAADFSGKSIGVADSKNYLDLEPFEIEGATFDRATLTNISMPSELDYRNNSFIGTRFVDAYFHRAQSLDFRDVSATNLQWASAHNSSITGGKIKGFKPYDLKECKFTKVEIDGFKAVDVHFLFNQCQFKNCVFHASQLIDTAFINCTFADCKFTAGEICQIKFEKCKFKNVKFQKLKLHEIELRKAELSNVDFDTVDLFDVDFSTSKLSGVKFKNCKTSCVRLDAKQLSKIKGVEQADLFAPLSGKAANRLAKTIVDSDEFSVTIKAKLAGKQTQFTIEKSWYSQKYLQQTGTKIEKLEVGRWHTAPFKLAAIDALHGLNWLAARARGAAPAFESLKIKTAKCPLKGHELNALLTEALTEIFGSVAVTSQVVAAKRRAKVQSVSQSKKEIIATLHADDVGAVNKVPAEYLKELKNFRKLKLTQRKLPGVKLVGIELNGTDFSGSDLRGASFVNADCQRVNFSDCQLQKVNFTDTDLRRVNLQGANLRGAIFNGNNLYSSNLKGADLTGCDLHGCFFYQVDLTDAKLDKVNFKGASYDERTIFPASTSLSLLKSMDWEGRGMPPHLRKQNKAVSGPLDFPAFLQRLNKITDPSRMKKAIAMLKKDAFQLFAETSPQQVTGVVKSQTDAALVYAVRLADDGKFSCCTQNLNPCGGLRGAICKHILVLLIGLTRSDELDATLVDQWVNATKIRQPELDKDAMANTFLKYKGAEAGEIDWRPTETLPEDYFV
jgi:uncharacterized protein YjbI with pentapeptide repeats